MAEMGGGGAQHTYTLVSRKPQKVEDPSATGSLLRTYSAGPVVSDLLSRSKRPKAGNALQPLMTRKPQLQSYTIRVWSYETFIVSASSSSG